MASGSRSCHSDPKNECDQFSRPSRSRQEGSDRHNLNKRRLTLKSYNQRGNHYRKSWVNKTNLVFKQLDDEFLNQNEPEKNKFRQRSDLERNNRSDFVNKSSFILTESPNGWYTVNIPNVENCEVLKIIEVYIMPVVFIPYNKKCFDETISFLVDNFEVAKKLLNSSHKIKLINNLRLIIKVNIYLPSLETILFTPISSEIKEKMIEAVSTRYNASTKCLDLSKFHTCSSFIENQLFVPLNQPTVLLSAFKIVAQHIKNDLYGLSLSDNHIYLGEELIWIRRFFPDLKVLDLSGNKFSYFKKMKSLAGFTIEVLNLSRNPLCIRKNKEKYRHVAQQYFPMLTKLDDSDLPSQYNTTVFTKLKMLINLDNFYPVPEGHDHRLPNPLALLVESFLTTFYEKYDNNISRQFIAEAYHENASFTLSCNFPKYKYKKKGNSNLYLSESRNFLKFNQNRQERSSFMHKGKYSIVNFFNKLPKTKHDLGSFVVDVPLANTDIIEIVVNGVFAENFENTDYRHVFRSFSRSFCIVPFNSGWNIISDMMFVTCITQELLVESSKRFHVFKPIQASRINCNTSNNVSMFLEDNNKMEGTESSFFQQSARPNYDPPPYQPTDFFSYESSINRQQPPPYLGNLQVRNVQSQSTDFQPLNHSMTTAAATLQSNTLLNTSFLSNFNAAVLSKNSYLAPIPNNQLSGGVSLNPIGDANANLDNKLAMIKSFSKESGMNDKWTIKCLEENSWDYVKAALCFSKLKDTIPSEAFIQNT